jgi:hypothetical protein
LKETSGKNNTYKNHQPKSKSSQTAITHKRIQDFAHDGVEIAIF